MIEKRHIIVQTTEAPSKLTPEFIVLSIRWSEAERAHRLLLMLTTLHFTSTLLLGLFGVQLVVILLCHLGSLLLQAMLHGILKWRHEQELSKMLENLNE